MSDQPEMEDKEGMASETQNGKKGESDGEGSV
jgi:hypothetical protein